MNSFLGLAKEATSTCPAEEAEVAETRVSVPAKEAEPPPLCQGGRNTPSGPGTGRELPTPRPTPSPDPTSTPFSYPFAHPRKFGLIAQVLLGPALHWANGQIPPLPLPKCTYNSNPDRQQRGASAPNPSLCRVAWNRFRKTPRCFPGLSAGVSRHSKATQGVGVAGCRTTSPRYGCARRPWSKGRVWGAQKDCPPPPVVKTNG